ncbi:DUF4270 family protein [Sphingobacterium griseoflavum]|uniref:DUF4270 domain-containing protein n=1 Tax=Sphingobacterium griseoflavum TaxID=1474952 RepID=A0ABQ3I232_9SPHI|nr:DUF4270 family protein [Sphingobacterium griseoflavum]GHE46548.1 hypothetical protein GCM10017764_32200 [Sphingobacterium griseoflavum]
MNQFLKRSITFFALPVFILIIAGACDKDMSVMLDNSATNNVGVSFIDSFSIQTSTVQLNNMPSAGRGSILVGKAADSRFGEVKATSYFRIGFSSIANDIPDAAVFDSLNLVLRPNTNRYYFGDTTKTQRLSVHRLEQVLETKTLTGGVQNTALPIYVTGPSIFNDQTFDYSPTSIGAISFAPRVRSLDSLNIRLDPSLGQEFFDLIKTNDLRVSSNENFRDYFKGLVLVPDEDNSAVVAFGYDSVQVKINYTYVGTDGFKRSGYKILNLVDGNLQFNHLDYDRTGTIFEPLTATNRELTSSATAGLTYLQSGTGVVAKVEFPSLKEFLQDENISINKAELVIETSSPANTMYPIPGTLVLLVADFNGVPVSIVQPLVPTQQQPFLLSFYQVGDQMGRNGKYTFNMLSYMKNLKSTSFFDNTSLYISSVIPADSRTFSNFDTALIAVENAKPKIKLNILYTKFR